MVTDQQRIYFLFIFKYLVACDFFLTIIIIKQQLNANQRLISLSMTNTDK